MSQIKLFTDIGSSKDEAYFKDQVSNMLGQIQVIVNGQLEFDQNLKTQTVTQVIGTVPVAINHRLNKIGVKYIVADKNAAADLFHVASRDNKDTIFLQSTVTGVKFTVILF